MIVLIQSVRLCRGLQNLHSLFLDHRPHSKSRRTTSLSSRSYIFLIRLLSAIINRVFEYQNVKERSCGVQKFLVAVGGRLSVCIVHDLLKFLGNSA